MNLAIIIGVSKYTHVAPLLGCSVDAMNMRDLLVATRKFDNIITITDRTHSHQIKAALNAIADRYSNESVDEMVIYFSGHGVFNKQVLLCCSDFDPHRPAESPLENKFLDEMFRRVRPRLSVKVLDACQSGEAYIKGPDDAFKKALSNQPLESFICMASSRYDQSSIATPQGSVFTNLLIDAALSRKYGTVRYSEIQNDLALAFEKDPTQKPFFVNQGHGLDIFAQVTDQMNILAKNRGNYASL